MINTSMEKILAIIGNLYLEVSVLREENAELNKALVRLRMELEEIKLSLAENKLSPETQAIVDRKIENPYKLKD